MGGEEGVVVRDEIGVMDCSAKGQMFNFEVDWKGKLNKRKPRVSQCSRPGGCADTLYDRVGVVVEYKVRAVTHKGCCLRSPSGSR